MIEPCYDPIGSLMPYFAARSEIETRQDRNKLGGKAEAGYYVA